MNETRVSLAIDTGPILQYFHDTPLGKVFLEDILSNERYDNFYVSPLVQTELLYILCREEGLDSARKKITQFLKDFTLVTEDVLREEAARLKCIYGLSLADCYSLAIGSLRKIPVCIKREKEINTILLKHTDFPVEILFLDEVPGKEPSRAAGT